MFPITLEFKDDKIATCWPPCYGFLRGCEWDDWDQTFYHDSWAIRAVKRGHIYDTSSITSERLLGDRISSTCTDTGENAVPGNVFNLEDLRVIWNSGARTPIEARVNLEDEKPTAWRFPEDVDHTCYDKSKLERHDESALDVYNEKYGKLTLRQVMTDLEKAIDKDSESVLRFRDNGHGEILGVSTLDVPCDRVLFYLMVARDLDNYGVSEKALTFLRLHYSYGVPIMVAFMASRLLAYSKYSDKDYIVFAGSTNDSCILPSGNFWVGCAARYMQPTQVQWEQHAYTSGSGHDRDDDMGSFYMEPTIEGIGKVSEEFNETMFNAIFGGYYNGETGHIMYDRPGGEPVKNAVSELYRAVAKPDSYRQRGSGGYCSNWTSDRELQNDDQNVFRIKNSLWIDTLISLLTEK